MPKAPSSRRYAQAVFEIALEGNALEGWSEDLEQLQRAIGQREFAAFLESIRVPLTEKYSAIEKVLPEVRRLAKNLLSLLVTRGTFRKLPEIIREYHRLSDVHRGIERGEVLTAVEVPDHLSKEIADLLRNIVGKDVVFTNRVDDDILGGFVAKVGDKLIDGSTKSRLEDLRRSVLSSAP